MDLICHAEAVRRRNLRRVNVVFRYFRRKISAVENTQIGQDCKVIQNTVVHMFGNEEKTGICEELTRPAKRAFILQESRE
jgi:hypothetical protein